MRVVLATRNSHKLREFERLIGGEVGLDPLPDELELPPETGSTYAENALIKARAAAAGTRRPAIADDSGIEAEALRGAPGVRSARFAGPRASDAENLAKLCAEVPAGSGLRYVCVIASVTPGGGVEHCSTGECRGIMASAPRGAGGFGYDPVFVPLDQSGAFSMAELSDAEKDAISHRGRAVHAYRAWLAAEG
jgi:XTP/dITP diphosphohydrolase